MSLVQGLAGQPGLLAVCAALFGAVVGSFLNVVILRLPRMMEAQWLEDGREAMRLLAEREAEQAGLPSAAGPPGQAQPVAASASDPSLSGSPESGSPEPQAAASPRLSLSYPPSHCPHCKTPIRPWHNVPVLSWLWLRGRCAACKAPISPQYPLVEAVSALLCALCALHFGPTPQLLAALVATWLLLALSVIDLNTQLLPDSLTLPLLWLGLLLNAFGVFVSPQEAIIGAAAGYLSLRGVYEAFKALTGQEGMGFGDFKLMAAFGAWLGWRMLPEIILLSSLVGAVVGVGLIAARRSQWRTAIPFGPYIAGAGWIALLWGRQLFDAYWDLASGGHG